MGEGSLTKRKVKICRGNQAGCDHKLHPFELLESVGRISPDGEGVEHGKRK